MLREFTCYSADLSTPLGNNKHIIDVERDMYLRIDILKNEATRVCCTLFEPHADEYTWLLLNHVCSGLLDSMQASFKLGYLFGLASTPLGGI